MNRYLLENQNFTDYTLFAGASGVNFINCYVPRTNESYPDEALKSFTFDELKQVGALARINQTSKNHKHLPIAYSPDIFEAKRGCLGGKLFFYISPDGNVKACPFQKNILGNINTQSLTQIILNYDKICCREICAMNLLLRNE